MHDDFINVDPYERKAFGEKLIEFEENMKAAVQSLKSRLSDAAGRLQDPGSVFYIAEAENLVTEIEAMLNGNITETGNQHKSKAQAQIDLMEDYNAKMHH